MPKLKSIPEAMFRLTKPCTTCPFRKQGGLALRPGRLEGIIESLVHDDWSNFQCHDTVQARTGGRWDDAGRYHASGQEAMCAGAAIYLAKAGRPTVGMRLGAALGYFNIERLRPHWDAIIEPLADVPSGSGSAHSAD